MPANPLRHQVAHIKSADGAMKAFQVEIADRLGRGDCFDGELDPAVDQDLSIGGLRAETGAEIDHRAVRRIMKTALVADAAQGGMPRGDADAEAELVAETAPFLHQR